VKRLSAKDIDLESLGPAEVRSPGERDPPGHGSAAQHDLALDRRLKGDPVSNAAVRIAGEIAMLAMASQLGYNSLISQTTFQILYFHSIH
jgi:hypothetical protein